MKHLFIAAALTLLIPASLVKPAEAQFSRIIFDPQNFAQNILTASRTLTQINHQVTQIQNKIRMLENQARHLERLPDSIASQIRDRLFRIDELIKTAEGISYDVSKIESQYEEIFRETYGDNPPSAPRIIQEARAAWQQSRNGYKHSLQVQAGVVQNVRADIIELERAMGRSHSAAGSLQAQQAGNEIAAMTAKQIMQMQELLAAHYRAEALERSRVLSEQERGRDRLQRFLGNGSIYTPGG